MCQDVSSGQVCSRADLAVLVQTVLKALMTIHRLMRESDLSFLEEVCPSTAFMTLCLDLTCAWHP